MAIGASVHAGDLTLPSGVTLAVEPDILVLHVIAAPTAEQLEAELGLPEGEEAEAGEARRPRLLLRLPARAASGPRPSRPATQSS